jgi:uncharacterized protein YecE (DUF72 family)
MPDLRIGISGWTYAGWRGDFYPPGLPRRRELEYASRRFSSIEINGSFYSLQRPGSYAAWYDATPPGFRFALKGSRFITHNKKLRDIEAPLANFFASGVLRLEEKLGPILWQFSRTLRFTDDRFDRFLELLPRTAEEAAALAERRDRRLRWEPWTETKRNHRLRHVIEVRHESFLVPEFARLLRRHGIALVFSDAADWPYVEELTAGLVYLRLHGSRQTYASRYTDAELDRWADRIRSWLRGSEPGDARKITDLQPPPRRSRDLYVYFDNDQKAQAPKDAARLTSRLEDLLTYRE